MSASVITDENYIIQLMAGGVGSNFYPQNTKDDIAKNKIQKQLPRLIHKEKCCCDLATD